MTILKEKADWALEVKAKYTYRIFRNGNDDMTVEVQLTDDFKRANLKNYAQATMSKEDFRCASLRCINHLFQVLRKRISENGSCYTNLPVY